jgi:hypothetical protein
MDLKKVKKIIENDYELKNILAGNVKKINTSILELLDDLNDIISELTNNINDIKQFMSICSYAEFVYIGNLLPELYLNLQSTVIFDYFKKNIKRFHLNSNELLEDLYNYGLSTIYHLDKKMMARLALLDDAIWKEFDEKSKSDEIENYNFQTEQNNKKRIHELTKNLDETIQYFDTCSQLELYWSYQILEDICDYFQSAELLDCIKRNITRFDDKNLQDILCEEYAYCIKVIDKKD